MSYQGVEKTGGRKEYNMFPSPYYPGKSTKRKPVQNSFFKGALYADPNPKPKTLNPTGRRHVEHPCNNMKAPDMAMSSFEL